MRNYVEEDFRLTVCGLIALRRSASCRKRPTRICADARAQRRQRIESIKEWFVRLVRLLLVVTFSAQPARADFVQASCAACLTSRAVLLICRRPIYQGGDDAALARAPEGRDERKRACAVAAFVQAFEQHTDDAVAA